MVNKAVIFILGAVVGILIYHFLFKPETIEKETMRTVTETKYMDVEERMYWSSLTDSLTSELSKKPRVVQEIIRDTVFTEPYDIKIRGFRADFPVLYGNIRFEGEVLGELLKTSIHTDLKVPIVTNTIEKTRTVIEKPSGLYLVGGVSNDFSYNVGSVYLKDKSLFQYQYNINRNLHSISVGFKVF